jgi:hypothetical protein
MTSGQGFSLDLPSLFSYLCNFVKAGMRVYTLDENAPTSEGGFWIRVQAAAWPFPRHMRKEPPTPNIRAIIKSDDAK